MPRVARGRLRVQGRGSHAAIFREDPTMPPFISPIWPDQKRWDKNVTFTKFLFHMDNNGTWRFLVVGASEAPLGSSGNAPVCK